MKTNKQVAQLILDLFDGGEHWGKHSYAQSKGRVRVSVDDEDAYKFCLLGAGQKLYNEFKITDEERCKFNRKLEKTIKNNTNSKFVTILDWNDAKERKYEDVETILKGI